MDDSLSIIVPVRNAQATLAEQLHHWLDLLPDLTNDFEIVVVDDGSSDHTAEIAADFACKYPQLRLIRHATPRGIELAIQTGLSQATAVTVLVQDDGQISPADVRRLWALRHDDDLILARAQRQPGIFDPGLVERIMTWGQTLRNFARRASPGGIQMIRRDAAQSLAGANTVIFDGASTGRYTTTPIAHP